jgi:hypothetical protein
VGQIQLTGTLTVGPVSSGDNVFPSATSSVNLASTPNPKPSTVDTGMVTRTIASPNAYVGLSGVGASDTVTKCDTFYFKCNSPMKLRITYFDVGGDIMSVEPVNGTKVSEAPAGNYIKLLEVQGSGPIEYLASGQQ